MTALEYVAGLVRAVLVADGNDASVAYVDRIMAVDQ